ncbi:MAG TPA: CocE/NonD family hydrolase [Mycobacteriales bacterium]|nr:CocE/NonD family hydrolase [Mycobacteriales bacterium]
MATVTDRSARRANTYLITVAGLCAALLAAGPGAARAAQVSGPKVLDAPPSLVGLSPELPASVVNASTSPGSHWQPERATYGTASHNDIAVKGAGGTTIRVNEIYPTTHGRPAKGPFPVIMTMTPYGKGSGGSSGPGTAQTSSGGSATGGANNYLVQRGYIDIVEDVRGTGDSGGSWGLFDPIQQKDAIKVLRWAAHLKHSNGRVGTYGPSYLGIDQALLAGAVGKHSPLKAIFPMVTANDPYRDTSFMGGLLDAEFSTAYLGLTGALNTEGPVTDTLTDQKLIDQLETIETDHINGLASYHAAFTAATLTGAPAAYDEHYWKQRSPQSVLRRIVANHIPAFLVGGEFDIFQHGEPINYAELQNAWAGRGVTAPMRPGQQVTGRYQLIDGPWEHLNGSAVDVDYLELEWFDTWLKGEHTGMANTPTPLHYYDLGTGRFDETTTYPFSHTRPTRFYLAPGQALRTKPAGSGHTTLAWLPAGSPCGRPIDQWSMGGVSIPSHMAGLMAPCADDDTASKLGPGQVSFTSAPFRSAEAIAGPISATVYASATTTNTQWVATVDDVTPSGSSYPLTEGALLGSLRAVDRGRSWTSHGVLLLPYHSYTLAAAKHVVPGRVTRYDIEIFPTLATIAKGDRLRLTLSTSDTPHLTPLPGQLPDLIGGVYSLNYGASAPSALNVELRRP